MVTLKFLSVGLLDLAHKFRYHQLFHDTATLKPLVSYE